MNCLIPITFQKKEGRAAYRQIADQIGGLIRSGELSPGEKLPPERDLAQNLGVARGTIKKAYEQLVQQKLVVATQGRGSFVAGIVHPEPANRQQRAMAEIHEAICRLEDLRFSHGEIGNLFALLLEQRKEQVGRFSVATIDCNPEALEIYHRQISLLSHLNISRILLDSLREAYDPRFMLAPFDLVVTTNKHFSEVSELAPGLGEKLLQVGVCPSPETLVSLGSLDSIQPIGILHRSDQFLSIVEKWLDQFHLNAPRAGLKPTEKEDISSFLATRRVLIVPPAFSLGFSQKQLGALQTFRETGGRILNFEYQIERGSLLYLEERLKQLLSHPISTRTQS